MSVEKVRVRDRGRIALHRAIGRQEEEAAECVDRLGVEARVLFRLHVEIVAREVVARAPEAVLCEDELYRAAERREVHSHWRGEARKADALECAGDLRALASVAAVFECAFLLAVGEQIE